MECQIRSLDLHAVTSILCGYPDGTFAVQNSLAVGGSQSRRYVFHVASACR